ncbi:MAG: DUF5011 domain-containing protein, partial [bacterium]|nr:DUF5011 domain-containing protein [bacterium]
TNENGPIKPGDYLTSSASKPGFAMKATRSGITIGKALGEFNAAQGMVMVFIDVGYRQVGWTFDLEDTLPDGVLQGQATGTPNSFVINQHGSGDIMRLQENGDTRFLFRNDGSMEINARVDDDSTKELVVIKSNDAEVFTINSRGDVSISGVIRVKNNSFAGSIITDENGNAEIKFDYHLGTGKPSVQLTPEGDEFALAQIAKFIQDEAKNYTGFLLKAVGFENKEPAASTTVHYWVVAKQDGYYSATTTPVVVVDEPEAPVQINVVENPGAPVININGNNPARIELGETYNDLGATVTDDEDNNLGVQVSGAEINTSEIGTSTITYTATDNDGNTTTATREVVVYDQNVVVVEEVVSPESGEEVATEEVTPIAEPEVISAPEPTPPADPVPDATSTPEESAPVVEDTAAPVPASAPEPTPVPAIEPEPESEPAPEPAPPPAGGPTPEPDPTPIPASEPASEPTIELAPEPTSPPASEPPSGE